MPILLFLDRGTTANCAIRCGAWVMVPGTKYRMVTDKIVEGRAHGNAISGASLFRNEIGFSKLWRKSPVVGSAWEEVESLDTDAFGHWTSESLPEFYDYQDGTGRRWRYGLGATVDAIDYIAPGGYAYQREYIAGLVAIGGLGLCVFDQLPNFAYVFYTGDGTKHVYNAPPDYWFANQISQAHYGLPRTDTTTDDASPSGYVDRNGAIHLFVVISGELTRLDSDDWGQSWSAAVATAITGDQGHVWLSEDGTNQFCVYVAGGAFTFAESADDFTTVQADELITTGVDNAQVSGYHGTDGRVYAYAFVSGVLTCWRSDARGRGFVERGTV